MAIPIGPTDIPLIIGGYVGLKIVNVCLDEVIGAIQRVVRPADKTSVSVTTHEYCLQSRRDTDKAVLDELTRVHSEVEGVRKLLVAFMMREGKALEMEDFTSLGVFK